MKLSSQGAIRIRELSGTAELETVLRKVTRLLADLGIPHWVVGGIAVQEHGYFRMTTDVDIVVPDAKQVREELLAHGFAKDPKSRITMIDASGAKVDVFQAGEKPTGREKLPFLSRPKFRPSPKSCPWTP